MNISAHLSAVRRRIVRQCSPVARCTAAAILLALTGTAHAAFQNGGFENDLANWNVRYLKVPSSGIPSATFPPTTETDLALTAWTTGTPAPTDAVGNGTDTNVGGAVKFPLYGLKTARINYNGAQYRAASIDQTATMTLADVDPADNKAHVRFAVAPVLQNPGHPKEQQPYFFVEVVNVTKGTKLFYTFNFSGQSGVPWKTVGSYQYTDWQTIDIAPGAGQLDVGDQVKVTVIAAGCAQSGHSGHIYMDSGAGLTNLPGPGIKANGPEFTAAAATVPYVYTYSNQGDVPLTNTVVTIVSPQDNSATPKNLLEVGAVLPPGCTKATAGGIDTITCAVGTLNPGSSGTIDLSFFAPSPTVGPINHGNYSITGDAISPLLGPLVQSQITTDPLVDLAVTLSDGQNAVIWGQALSYTLAVTNNGPTAVPAGANIATNGPAALTGVSWTCTGSGGATCPNPSGTGTINQTTTAAMPVGGALTYVITAQANPAGTGASNVIHSATATAPAGVQDAEDANNIATDVDPIGLGLFQLDVAISGTPGTVTSVPSGINCGAVCTSNQPGGSLVILYATAPPGSIFAGWSGGGCTGVAPSCTVNMDAAKSVTATFQAPLTVTAAVIGGNGTVSPTAPQPVPTGGTKAFTVSPDAGYAPQFTDTCGPAGAPAGGTFVGSTYTTNAIQQDCTLSVSFTNVGVATVTPSVGGGGSITPNAPKTVLVGEPVTFTITPTSGYTFATPGGTCPAGTLTGTTYTIAAVPATCTVSFAFLPPAVVTATAGTGTGTVTPASQTVSVGGSAVVDLVPGAGLRAALAPASTCAGGSFNANFTQYTVPGISANCALVFDFAPIPVMQSIPTLSQWGLLLLSGLIGLLMIGQRRRFM